MPQLLDTYIFNDANLQGYWKLESNLNDSSKVGATLTGINTVAYTTGKWSTGYTQSNNKTNYLRSTSSFNVDGGAMSMGCWFKDVGTETGVTERGIMSQVNITSKTRFGIACQGTNLYFGRDGIGGGGTPGSVLVPWSTYTSTSIFRLYVLTYDGSTIRAYVDGNFVGSAAASGNGAGYAGAVTGFGVGIFQGWAGWDTSYNANGIYDDVFIYNRELKPGEVMGLYKLLGYPNGYKTINGGTNLRPRPFAPGIAR